MPSGSPLRIALSNLIKEVLSEIQSSTVSADPEEGTVISVNDDSTVNVQTSSSMYSSVGTPIVLTIGALVTVITADGKKVAIPR